MKGIIKRLLSVLLIVMLLGTCGQVLALEITDSGEKNKTEESSDIQSNSDDRDEEDPDNASDPDAPSDLLASEKESGKNENDDPHQNDGNGNDDNENDGEGNGDNGNCDNGNGDNENDGDGNGENGNGDSGNGDSGNDNEDSENKENENKGDETERKREIQVKSEENRELRTSYGTEVGSGPANESGNVTWTEYTNDEGEDILVFRVVDASLGGEDCAITTALGYPYSARVTKVVLEDGITGIGWFTEIGQKGKREIFQDFKALTVVEPCASLQRIGWSAFRRCSKLCSFDFTVCKNLQMINNQAFSPCASMGEVDLSGCAALTHIALGAFNQDAAQDHYVSTMVVTLPEGGGALQVIKESAFQGTAIKTLDLSHTSIKEIDKNVFKNCRALETVVIHEGVTYINNNSFMSANAIKTLVFNAKNCKQIQNVFTYSSSYDLIVGGSVETLQNKFFDATRTAGAIFFEGIEGGHVIIMNSGATDNAAVPMVSAISHNCYVDGQGVVYELNSDGTAKVAYCSPYPSITEYTVPATITANGTEYTVTSVADSAFTLAPSLQTISFANAAQITSIGDEAFKGVGTLTKVVAGDEEALTVEDAIALFADGVVGTDAFKDTGLGYKVTVKYLVEEAVPIAGSTLYGEMPTVDGDDEISALSFDEHPLQDLTAQTYQTIRGDGSGHFPIFTYLFAGWKAEDGQVHAPGETIGPLSAFDPDKDGVIKLVTVWSDGWGSGSGTPSAEFSVWANAKTANEMIAEGKMIDENSSFYSHVVGGAIMCAVDGDGNTIPPEELSSPSHGGAGAPNIGDIYADYEARFPETAPEGKYLMISYLNSDVQTADSNIRSLTSGYETSDSEAGTVKWKLSDLPTDAAVLSRLKSMVENGEKTLRDEQGEIIPAEKLNTDDMLVRWIQVKYQSTSSDGWNINAVLKSKFDYTVRYDAHGGTGTMSDQIIRYDETVELTENAFTREHYRFSGWKDAYGNSYSDKQSVRNLLESEGTVTLYAQWEAEVEVSVVGSENSVTYNGKEQSNDGFTVIYTVGGVQGSLPSEITADVDVPTVSGINAGTYAGTVTAALGGTAEGYVIKTASASADIVLNIERAAVTVKANDSSKTAGNADPVFTATIIGLVNGENASLISYSFVRETGETAGTYAVTPAGEAVQGNYTVSFVPGKLTIKPAAVPTPSPSPTPTPTPTQPPAPVRPPVRTPTPVHTPAPVTTPSPSPTPTPAPTPTPTLVPAAAPVPAPTPSPAPAPTPTPAAEESWALVNLIAALATVATSFGMAVSYFGGKDGASKAKFFGLIPALMSIAAFVLTENMGSRMALVDKWTIPMIVLLLANGILAWITRSGESGDAA